MIQTAWCQDLLPSDDRTVKCWNRPCRKRLEPADSVSRFGVFCSSECERAERGA